MSEIRLIAGLGNPGPEFAGSRHNVGFEVVDRLAALHGAGFSSCREKALVASIRANQAPVLLVKPQTFMNLSGLAVRALLKKHRLSPGALLVVYDDLDLPLGQLRLLPRGSSGGHKGMASVIAAVGTEDFARLRVGIGRPTGDAAAYVLSRFLPEEIEPVQRVLEEAVAAVECVLREGLVRAMNKFNRRR